MDNQWMDWMAPGLGFFEGKSRDKWILLGVVLLCLLLLAGYGLSIGIRVDPLWVEKIVLHGPHGCGCQQEVGEMVELNDDEVWKFTKLYNRSTHAGLITVDRCETKFSADVYLKDGTTIYLREAYGSKLYLSSPKTERYWVYNSRLHDYIAELLDKYDLHTD
jgi:hypothetical protein